VTARKRLCGRKKNLLGRRFCKGRWKRSQEMNWSSEEEGGVERSKSRRKSEEQPRIADALGRARGAKKGKKRNDRENKPERCQARKKSAAGGFGAQRGKERKNPQGGAGLRLWTKKKSQQKKGGKTKKVGQSAGGFMGNENYPDPGRAVLFVPSKGPAREKGEVEGLRKVGKKAPLTPKRRFRGADA